MHFAKFLRIPILKNIFERLLLAIFPFTYQNISQDSELCLGPSQTSIMESNESIIEVCQVLKYASDVWQQTDVKRS